MLPKCCANSVPSDLSLELPSSVQPESKKKDSTIQLKIRRDKFEGIRSSTYPLKSNYPEIDIKTRELQVVSELSNDGMKLSKHEIYVGYVNSLPEKWLSFSQGVRNANHTQTLDFADIYGMFVYEDNMISRRYPESKKDLITAPPTTSISIAFFSNNIVQEEVSDFKEMTQVNVLMALADDELAVGKNHASNGEWIDITIRKITESSSKNDVKENAFIPASMDYDHEMIPKSKDLVERHNLDNKLPNFNIGRILVLESQAVNESLGLIEAPTDPESSKESRSEPLTPSPLLKNLQVASPSSEVMPLTYQEHSRRERHGLGTLKHTKPETNNLQDHITSDHKVYVASLKNSENYKAQPYQYASPSKQILKAKRHIMEPIWYLDSGYSRSMTDVKSYLHKYMEKPGPKVVFGDTSSCITEGYGSINCGGMVFSKVAFVNGLKYDLIRIS
ncbi:hypothetical protein Tco_0762935 [Tanacetum coccineum]